MKFNSPEVFQASEADPKDQMNVTWQVMPLLGRQVELSKDGFLSMDVYFGPGLVINNRLDQADLKLVIGLNVGMSFLKKNEKQ